jgi:pyruvate dehydrogenase E1 component
MMADILASNTTPANSNESKILKQEWLDSLDYILEFYGADQAKEILKDLHNKLSQENIPFTGIDLATAYQNSISSAQQVPFPGDVEMEQRIENIVRWNAMAMVLQGYDSGTAVGGHIASFGSSATLYEVGYNYFFRSKSADYGGDVVVYQGHTAPGMYARAFLEGRFEEGQIKNFRRELGDGGGVPSYPHPRRLRDFWQLPSVSMGLGSMGAVYQARFNRYLENRGLKPKNGGRVWAFLGDGETDEPEVIGTLNIAAREKLDNLTFIINCNLQRLDGPVRGNGKIVQELEHIFLGLGWNVIKVVWSEDYDALFAKDVNQTLQNRLSAMVDGDFQLISTFLDGSKVREFIANGNAEILDILSELSDDQVRSLRRGGHDRKKVFAAYDRAMNSVGKPSVILVKTIKGFGMGKVGEGQNTTHQTKTMVAKDRWEAAKRFGVQITEAEAEKATFYHPGADSPEVKYLLAKRANLGGTFPLRTTDFVPFEMPSQEVFKVAYEDGTKGKDASTMMTFAQLILPNLLKNSALSKYITPIICDEAQTFGLQGLFKSIGIYNPAGQQYKPVDAGNIVSEYKEKTDGQVLQEGICEAGSMATFTAAGTAYATHGVPIIPFYIYYSMFGFQRIGDQAWACGDALCKGFLMGGTAGRTSLNGEGTQHQDGHSHVIAATVPNCKSYDPAYAYEMAAIVHHGIQEMYIDKKDCFYYITIYNDNYVQPAMPSHVKHADIVKGMYNYNRSSLKKAKAKVQLLGSGPLLHQALSAQVLLADYGIAADVWSVTSYVELSREATAIDRHNMLHQDNKKPYITSLLEKEEGPVVAVSDSMKLLHNMVAPWIPGDFFALGADGFGLSESRENLRDHFEISPKFIALAAMHRLMLQQKLTKADLKKFIKDQGIDVNKADSMYF